MFVIPAMEIRFGVILFFISLVCNSWSAVDIGKYLKVCDRNSIEGNECLVDAIQDGLLVLSDGIKELGAPPVDPYHQKELRIEYKRNQIMVKMTMKDIYVEGLRRAKVHDARLRADEDSFYLEVDMTTPQIYVRGHYIGEGSFNSIQINTTGEFNATMTDLVFTWKLNGKPEQKNNDTYMKIESFYMRPDVGNLKSYLANDNPNSRGFTNLGNEFANGNWKMLYREFLPFAQANWNKIGIKVSNKIFLQVPYNQLFPIQS